ncbi:unnamed protein product [Spirodela intermedia]|uniref:Uncharacterized protein n=1 Tax=Spirodela intermedia TaxID=51605 RepID=A0A7I8KHH5_SPIIN|nr:unnamed protein product [Spirodela intermedia]
MEARARRATTAAAAARHCAQGSKKATQPPPRPRPGKAVPAGYFTAESFLVLFCLTASLLILPLILPPLQPPPLLLLLVPIGILVVLLALALMPSDIRNIASPYL